MKEYIPVITQLIQKSSGEKKGLEEKQEELKQFSQQVEGLVNVINGVLDRFSEVEMPANVYCVLMINNFLILIDALVAFMMTRLTETSSDLQSKVKQAVDGIKRELVGMSEYLISGKLEKPRAD